MKTTTLLLFSFFIGLCYSQNYSLKPYFASPTGDLGYLIKKSAGIEFAGNNLYSDDFFTGKIGGGFNFFLPRQEVNQTFISTYSGSNLTISEAEQTIDFFLTFYITIGGDLAILNKEDYKFYGGLNVLAGTSALKDNIGFVGEIFIGAGPHIGYLHRFENFGLYFEIERQFNIAPQKYIFNLNTFGVGITF